MPKKNKASLTHLWEPRFSEEAEAEIPLDQIRARARQPIGNGRTVDLAAAYEKYSDQVLDRTLTDGLKVAKRLSFER